MQTEEKNQEPLFIYCCLAEIILYACFYVPLLAEPGTCTNDCSTMFPISSVTWFEIVSGLTYFFLIPFSLSIILVKLYWNIKYIISKRFVQLSIASILLTLVNPLIYEDILGKNIAGLNTGQSASPYVISLILLTFLFAFTVKKFRDTTSERTDSLG